MNYMNTSESSIKIGIELQAEREKADITLREMAVKLGVDNSTISKWETGKNKISAVDLQNVSILSAHFNFYTEIYTETIGIPKAKAAKKRRDSVSHPVVPFHSVIGHNK